MWHIFFKRLMWREISFPCFRVSLWVYAAPYRGEIWREQRLVLHQIIHFGLLCLLLNCLALKIAYHGPNT